jgi:hypothetical protein
VRRDPLSSAHALVKKHAVFHGALFGLYSLHRLVTIREQGEVEEGVALEFRAQVRKVLTDISSVEGLRDIFAFPYGRLVELFNRRQTRCTPVEEPK